MTEANL